MSNLASGLGSENQEEEVHHEHETPRPDFLNTLSLIGKEEPRRQSEKNLHPIDGDHYN